MSETDNSLIYFADEKDMRSDNPIVKLAVVAITENSRVVKETEFNNIVHLSDRKIDQDILDCIRYDFRLKNCEYPRRDTKNAVSMLFEEFYFLVALLMKSKSFYLRLEDGRLKPFPVKSKKVNLTFDLSEGDVTVKLFKRKNSPELKAPFRLLSPGCIWTGSELLLLNDKTGFPPDELCNLFEKKRPTCDEFIDVLQTLDFEACTQFLRMPEEGVEVVKSKPVPVVCLSKHTIWPPQQRLKVEVIFRYADGVEFSDSDTRKSRLFAKKGKRYVRDEEEEVRIIAELKKHKCIKSDTILNGLMAFTPKLMPEVPSLLEEGWDVNSLGKPVRQPNRFDLNVKTKVDWFDLQGCVYYGDISFNLPSILKQAKEGKQIFQLKDGSMALLPENLSGALSVLSRFAEETKAGLRLGTNKVGLLDSLLSLQPEICVDEAYRRLKDGLLKQDELTLDPSERFQGALRPYQKDGLFWMKRLSEFGMNGCLADDMGLGKTVQVLALLDLHYTNAEKDFGKSLIVVPASLLHNWQKEAARFTPDLNVYLFERSADHDPQSKEYVSAHLIITTYAIMRNNIVELRELELDYCILDEAQAVKNADTVTSKSVRLLNAKHRLALSGTPVENHLGELWSLFEFLNPGMLGSVAAFQQLVDGKKSDIPPQTVEMLGKAVSPFILRRKKKEVATDLPEKTEITLYCDLEDKHRKAYENLRDDIRKQLLGLVEDQGVNKSKMQILESLLRLRQCACHPALIDKKSNVESSKINQLLENLEEIIEEGGKILVFSQFTSLLAHVKTALKEREITFEYLDGRTRKRQEKVDRFQQDPDCPVFLISLKAGGTGLNLTAAEYAFILDPWWNPAAEAQAIDRIHRIGQTKKVFAYKIIAKDTIEEKILQLQEQKKDVAEAILRAAGSVIRKLEATDLEMLLS